MKIRAQNLHLTEPSSDAEQRRPGCHHDQPGKQHYFVMSGEDTTTTTGSKIHDQHAESLPASLSTTRTIPPATKTTDARMLKSARTLLFPASLYGNEASPNSSSSKIASNNNNKNKKLNNHHSDDQDDDNNDEDDDDDDDTLEGRSPMNSPTEATAHTNHHHNNHMETTTNFDRSMATPSLVAPKEAGEWTRTTKECQRQDRHILSTDQPNPENGSVPLAVSSAILWVWIGFTIREMYEALQWHSFYLLNVVGGGGGLTLLVLAVLLLLPPQNPLATTRTTFTVSNVCFLFFALTTFWIQYYVKYPFHTQQIWQLVRRYASLDSHDSDDPPFQQGVVLAPVLLAGHSSHHHPPDHSSKSYHNPHHLASAIAVTKLHGLEEAADCLSSTLNLSFRQIMDWGELLFCLGMFALNVQALRQRPQTISWLASFLSVAAIVRTTWLLQLEEPEKETALISFSSSSKTESFSSSLSSSLVWLAALATVATLVTFLRFNVFLVETVATPQGEEEESKSLLPPPTRNYLYPYPNAPFAASPRPEQPPSSCDNRTGGEEEEPESWHTQEELEQLPVTPRPTTAAVVTPLSTTSPLDLPETLEEVVVLKPESWHTREELEQLPVNPRPATAAVVTPLSTTSPLDSPEALEETVATPQREEVEESLPPPPPRRNDLYPCPNAPLAASPRPEQIPSSFDNETGGERVPPHNNNSGCRINHREQPPQVYHDSSYSWVRPVAETRNPPPQVYPMDGRRGRTVPLLVPEQEVASSSRPENPGRPAEAEFTPPRPVARREDKEQEHAAQVESTTWNDRRSNTIASSPPGRTSPAAVASSTVITPAPIHSIRWNNVIPTTIPNTATNNHHSNHNDHNNCAHHIPSSCHNGTCGERVPPRNNNSSSRINHREQPPQVYHDSSYSWVRPVAETRNQPPQVYPMDGRRGRTVPLLVPEQEVASSSRPENPGRPAEAEFTPPRPVARREDKEQEQAAQVESTTWNDRRSNTIASSPPGRTMPAAGASSTMATPARVASTATNNRNHNYNSNYNSNHNSNHHNHNNNHNHNDHNYCEHRNYRIPVGARVMVLTKGNKRGVLARYTPTGRISVNFDDGTYGPGYKAENVVPV
ncbi:hypothetical protein ACA910_011442 [Epithemia clementina (nom. ined.)]